MAMLGLIGGVIGAIGAIQQGQAEAAQGKYQAAVAKNNQIISEQSAVYELQAGQVEEQASKMKTGQVIGEAHAAQGASGLETESGSAVKVRGTTGLIGDIDAATIRSNAAERAREYRIQGVNFDAQAGLYEMQAKQAQVASMFSAAGSIVGGLSSAFGSSGGMGMGSMFGSGSVAPKWNEMAATPTYTPFASTYGPYTSGPYPTARPAYVGTQPDMGAYTLPRY